MERLFNPKTIAIIGATPNKNKASHAIMKNVLTTFKGKIFLVNPKYKEIEGKKCYASVKDIKESIDLCVVVVNATISNKVIRECMEKGVKYVVVITAGYREVGGEGIKREMELKDMVKEFGYKTRIIGPNCLGILSTRSKLNVLFLPKSKIDDPLEGNISLIFQSGALGAAIIDRFASENIGINKFISYGNGCDLKDIDFLEYFIKDKSTKVIGMYLEGISDGRKLYDIIKRSSKPVVVIKGGRTKKGSASALTHTGSMAGSYEIFKGAMLQANAVIAENFNAFENYVKAFSLAKKPQNNSVLVITNGGGFGVLAGDAIEESNELEAYALKKHEEKALQKVLPSYANIHNPLDIIGDAGSKRYEDVLNIFRKSNVGSVVVVMLVQTFSLDEQIIEVLHKFRNTFKGSVLGVVEGGKYAHIIKHALERRSIPIYSSVYDAIQSLEKLYTYYFNSP